MKRLSSILCAIALLVIFTAPAVMAAGSCTTIQSGTLLTSAGGVITPGYDDYGYNYQANMFNGGYCDAYQNDSWCLPYANDELIMKWNDAWLSNVDCDYDGLLDRHYGFPTYRGSGAWLTNHQSGYVEVNENGKLKKWTYFSKIVAVPADATLSDGYWYTAEGIIIGYSIWDEFAVTEEIYNDPSAGAHGLLYKGLAAPGFGQY